MRALIVVATLALLASCAGGGSGTDGGAAECEQTTQGVDCSRLCNQYCAKRRQCGVNATNTCEDDCRTVLEAGASSDNYKCVVNSSCANISNCGI